MDADTHGYVWSPSGNSYPVSSIPKEKGPSLRTAPSWFKVKVFLGFSHVFVLELQFKRTWFYVENGLADYK